MRIESIAAKDKMAYNGNFATELILDLALLDCIWSFILDDGEELFNAHLEFL